MNGSKVELISALAAYKFILAKTIGNKVIAVSAFDFLTFLAVTSDCKGQVDVDCLNVEWIVDVSRVANCSSIAYSNVANADASTARSANICGEVIASIMVYVCNIVDNCCFPRCFWRFAWRGLGGASRGE